MAPPDHAGGGNAINRDAAWVLWMVLVFGARTQSAAQAMLEDSRRSREEESDFPTTEEAESDSEAESEGGTGREPG